MKNVRVTPACCFPVFLSLMVFLFISSIALGDDLDLGKKLFEGKCARCHSKDGTGNPKMLKVLNVPLNKINLHRDDVVHMSVFQIETMVDSGKHRMPKYRGKLTDAQIHEVAQYLKTMTGNASPEENNTRK